MRPTSDLDLHPGPGATWGEGQAPTRTTPGGPVLALDPRIRNTQKTLHVPGASAPRLILGFTIEQAGPRPGQNALSEGPARHRHSAAPSAKPAKPPAGTSLSPRPSRRLRRGARRLLRPHCHGCPTRRVARRRGPALRRVRAAAHPRAGRGGPPGTGESCGAPARAPPRPRLPSAPPSPRKPGCGRSAARSHGRSVLRGRCAVPGVDC